MNLRPWLVMIRGPIGLTSSVQANYARLKGGVFALTAKQLCGEGGKRHELAIR
jgi:hypothetical protein